MRANVGFMAGIALLLACKNEPEPLPPPKTPPLQTPTTASAPHSSATTAQTNATTSASSGGSAMPAGAEPRTFGFDGDAANASPAGFVLGRTGKGKLGKWVVLAQPDAPSKGNVLAQTDADDTDNRFPVAVANEPSLRDVRVRVRCKPVSGKVDQACGLVFRYQDENNYLLTRANALEGNVRLYYVKDGSRRQLASFSGAVKSGAWHELQAEVRGDHIQVTWDGAKAIDHHDTTFAGAGRVGVWTKADSVTYFDDLKVEAL